MFCTKIETEYNFKIDNTINIKYHVDVSFCMDFCSSVCFIGQLQLRKIQVEMAQRKQIKTQSLKQNYTVICYR